jgi:hypothetical protein
MAEIQIACLFREHFSREIPAFRVARPLHLSASCLMICESVET